MRPPATIERMLPPFVLAACLLAVIAFCAHGIASAPRVSANFWEASNVRNTCGRDHVGRLGCDTRDPGNLIPGRLVVEEVSDDRKRGPGDTRGAEIRASGECAAPRPDPASREARGRPVDARVAAGGDREAMASLPAVHPTGDAIARNPPLSGREGSLALAVFRVCINEAALQNIEDCALIWQVTRGHGASAGKRLAWLRKQAPRVLGSASPTGNSGWSRELLPDCRKPEAFPGGEAWWYKVARPRCLKVWAYAKELVEGRAKGQPCARQPATWGSPTLRVDAEYAAAHGLCRLHCKNVLNDGYAPCAMVKR